MSGNLEMGGNRVTGLADPSSAQDAATQASVNAAVSNAVLFGSTAAPDLFSLTGDGTTTAFTLEAETTTSLFAATSYLVSIDGVVQKPGDDFSISGVSGNVVITFSAAPPNGASIVVQALGFKVPVGDEQIPNGAITAAKLATDSVTTAKIQDAAVTSAKLASTVDFTGKTVTGLTNATVGLGNVSNVNTTNATNISSGTISSARFPLMATDSPFVFTPGAYGAVQANLCQIPRISVDDKGRINFAANDAWVGKRLIKSEVLTPALQAVQGLTGTNTVTETYVDILLPAGTTTTRTFTPLSANSTIKFKINYGVGYVGSNGSIGHYKLFLNGAEVRR
jgi:hypothetical protein